MTKPKPKNPTAPMYLLDMPQGRLAMLGFNFGGRMGRISFHIVAKKS